ncbi:MAG: class I SAM-dependent methyltransferase [Phycisphaerales bacterium]|nr:class I SAM-dependent methyltransferase [Phycisphaerales bacterium]
MYSETAALYDTIYAGIKDYPRESTDLAALVRDLVPSATRILDVACGTGRRAALLAETHGFTVDGIDLDDAMVGIASRRCPRGRFETADMSDFELGRVYDAILCLFSSIGYVRTTDRLVGAVRCMAQHVRPGGLVLIEPWFEPGVLEHGFVAATTAVKDGTHIARVSHTRLEAGLSHVTFEYIIGNREGLRRASETHTLGLFTSAEMTDAICGAGLEVIRHDVGGPMGRGLYVARRPPA